MKSSVDTIALSPLDSLPRTSRRGQPACLLPDLYLGDENALARFVCTQVEPIHQRGNPLLLVGPAGTGKTTLAFTIAARERLTHETDESTQHGHKLLYDSAIDFARDYASALDSDDLEHFRKRIATADLWVVDDIHMLADKAAAQEELSARIEARVTNGQTTILTCRRLPSELRGIRPMLASRMLPGLTVLLSVPSSKTRRPILSQLCRQADLDVSDDWVDLLERGLPLDLSVRQLAAIVEQLKLLAAHGEPLDANAVTAAIESIQGNGEPSIAAIAKAVARRFQLKTADLKSSTRRQQVVRARALAMYLGRQLTEASLQQIGAYFGGRDHSTVLHACRKTEALLATNSQLSQTADEVSEQLRSAG